MYSTILIFAIFSNFQGALSQQPPTLPDPLGIGIIPPVLGDLNGLGGFNGLSSAFSGPNGSWPLPYSRAAAEGWRKYFEQLQQARNQLHQTLTNVGSSIQNGDFKPPGMEAPIQHDVQETQIVKILTGPQIHDVQQARSQVTHLTQGQTTSRQPQNVGFEIVASATKPITSTVTSGTVPQVIPQVVGQIIPQLDSQPINWVSK